MHAPRLTLALARAAPAGLAGSLWVSVQTKITKFRMAFINTPWRQFSEALIICFLNTTILVRSSVQL